MVLDCCFYLTSYYKLQESYLLLQAMAMASKNYSASCICNSTHFQLNSISKLVIFSLFYLNLSNGHSKLLNSVLNKCLFTINS